MAAKKMKKTGGKKVTNDTKNNSSSKSKTTTTSSGSSSPSTSTLVFSVIIGIAIAGGFHMIHHPNSTKNHDLPVDVTTTTNNSNAMNTPPPQVPTISIAAFHTIDESLGGIASFHTIDESLGDFLKEVTEEEDNDEDSNTNDKAIKQQKEDLMKYLLYDDGYVSCLTDASGGEKDIFGVRSLKKAKYDFLLRVANHPQFWTVEFPSETKYHHASNKELLEASQPLINTCRFLTLTHEDYDGRAKTVVQEALKKEDLLENFSVKSQGPASDYRTAVCLHRLTDAASKVTPTTTAAQRELELLRTLRLEWMQNQKKIKEEAHAEPVRLMPQGWTVHREDKSGHLYYHNPEAGQTMWERPIPVFGGKGVIPDDPPPTESGKISFASTIARKDPCAMDDTRKILFGVV